ncbi:MAG: ROK family transcriptional regulator [Planctomycetaceae bacterium]|nr:ROK family transcriptional regulator [Planctomycetaceae bacterium]
MITIGTPESIGEANKKLILNHLRFKGDMSRADLTREIRMSFPSVSSNIRYLLEKGYIKEIGEGDNSMGRKAKLLSFNARRGFVIGIVIGANDTRFMLADLLGNPLTTTVRQTKSGESGTRLVKALAAVTRKLVDDSGVGSKNILAICVGIPGIVRDNERTFVTPRVLEFPFTELRIALEQVFAAEILIENDVNMGAIGEMWRGVATRYSDLVYIGYSIGLGAAVVLNGELYKGFDGAAGEVGFMAVDPRRLNQRFAGMGSLESLISGKHISASLAGGDYASEMVHVLRGCTGKNSREKRVLEEVAQYFGMVLINICALLNPQAIIVSGGIGRILGEHFAATWETMLTNHLPFTHEVVFSKLDGREQLLGAVYTALQHVYNAPITT